MDGLIWHGEPLVDRAIMVIAFEGLFDAGEAATDAIAQIRGSGDARHVAEIDPEEFFNFTENRPVVSLDDDGNRTLTWPQNEFHELQTPEGQPDVILLAGIEPQMRWGTFAQAIVEVTRRANVQLVVTLGAMAGLAPHTRALGVVGSATDPELARRLGLGRPSYEGPTGLVGAIHDALDDAHLPIISLRVSVPHYVPSPPNPEATRSLLARLELVTGIATDHRSLDSSAQEWRERVDQALADDPEMASYVARLEEHVAAAADELLPSGDDLAAELQAFLRDRE